jgi:hypothetical protein
MDIEGQPLIFVNDYHYLTGYHSTAILRLSVISCMFDENNQLLQKVYNK